MSKLILQVTVEVDGDVDEMATLIEEYLTSPECPFRDDYGPPSDYEGDLRQDGWEGPFVMDVSVLRISPIHTKEIA